MSLTPITSNPHFFTLFSYSLMLDCWKQDLNERPSFQELVERLERLMHQEVEYFDFDKVDESKDYYLVQDVKTNEDDVDGVDEL